MKKLFLILLFIFIGCDFFSDSKEDSGKEALLLFPLLPVTACTADCPYYNNNGDGLFGEYNLTLNGNAKISHPETVTTFDMDVYLLLRKDTRKTFSYRDALMQKKKVSDRISGLYDILANSNPTSGESNTYNSEITFLQKKKTEMDTDFQNQVYSKAYNSFLQYDGNEKMEVYSETVLQYSNPTNPKSPISSSPIYLKIENLTSSDMGTAMALSSTSEGKLFSIDYSGKRYSTEYSSSNLNVTITNIPSVGNTTNITISGTIYQSNDSLESLIISGTINAYRQNKK